MLADPNNGEQQPGAAGGRDGDDTEDDHPFVAWVTDSGIEIDSALAVMRMVTVLDTEISSSPYAREMWPGFGLLTGHEQLMVCAALWWAQQGFPVFPTRGPVPAICDAHRYERRRRGPKCKGREDGCDGWGHGHHDATTHPATIWHWWAGYHYKGCDISTALPPSFFCLDIEGDDDDGRPNGLAELARLQAEHDNLTPETFTVVSGHGDGGKHLFYRRLWSGELRAQIAGGVEVKTVSVLPPSRHKDTGEPYTMRDTPIVTASESLMRLVLKPRKPPRPRRDRPYIGAPVIEAFNAKGDWADLLTRHGWDCVGGDPDDGNSTWRHPNATQETSASLREDADGKRRLYVFSVNTPFEPSAPGTPCGHDYFDAVAVLEHDGDHAALMRALERNPFGTRH